MHTALILVVFQQFLPVVVNPGNMELVCHPLTRCDGAIGNCYDLTVWHLLKARNMAVAHVSAGTN